MDNVRIAVIGLTGVGSEHLKYLMPGKVADCTLTAVCDIKEEVADEKAAEAGVKAFYSHTELVESGICDAVLVATPHPFHPPLTIDALRGGLHVLCEKPLSVRPSEADAMLEEARRSGKLLAVMFQERLHPASKRLRELTESGEIGKLVNIAMLTPWYRTQAYYDHGAWRGTWKGEGGGLLVNQAPHNLDELYCLGGVPKRIVAVTGTRGHDIEVEDDCVAFLEYESSATGLFVANTLDAFGSERVEVLGTEAKLVREGGSLSIGRMVTQKGAIEGRDEMFSEPEIEWEDVDVPQAPHGHQACTQNFVDAILGRADLLAPGDDSINEVELASAMMLSGMKGKPVELPVDRDEYDAFLDEMIRRSGGK